MNGRKVLFAPGSGLGTQGWGKLDGRGNYNLWLLWHQIILSEQTAYGVLWWEKTFYRWSHNKRTNAPVAIWRWMILIPLLQNDWSDMPIHQRHTYPHVHTKTHTHSPSYYYSVKLQWTVLIEFPLWSSSWHRGIKRADDLVPLLYNISKWAREVAVGGFGPVRSVGPCWGIQNIF